MTQIFTQGHRHIVLDTMQVPGQGPCLMQVDWLGQLVLERANATSTGQDQDEASDDKKVLSMMTLGWESSKDEDEEEWKCGDLGHRRASHWTRLGKR